MLCHSAAQCGNDVAAQNDIGLYFRVAQVEIAVFEALALICFAGVVDLKRQLVVAAAAEHGDLRRRDLDVAGGELRVFAGALAHDARDGNGGFLIEGLYDVHHLFVFDDDLRGAVEIAQHQKRKVIADFADVLHPADQGDGLARICKAELTAGMGSRLCHGLFPLSFSITH